ncbi:MAG TPA: cobalamin-dependent protein, partial [Ignavibacteria bacterium]
MSKPSVVFVAFEEFDNLGMGYLASVLSKAGYDTRVIDFRSMKEDILKILKRQNPLIVGFSVIFQYHIYEFVDLINYIRERGILCHFTAGGHYASLKYEELFELIPSLDSIVRFEGEYTLLDLITCIHAGTDWKNVLGIAYKNNGKIIANPLRPLEKDLDKFPFPLRSPLTKYALDRKFATILAGRGCVNNCSFCHIREYYKQSSGPYKRIRKPG